MQASLTNGQIEADMLIPVTVLTGFLGSGKTTLLNRLLKSPALADTAVLINEFGDVPIDHLLVRESTEQVTVLESGCICCTVQGDLVQALRDLHFKRAKGQVPAFTRVIIETTGLADPAPILRTLIELPVLAARFSLSGVVTTVDAVHGDCQLASQFETQKQIAVADRIVITKVDQVDAVIVDGLRLRLAALNPAAGIFTAMSGEIDPECLLDTALYCADGKHPDVAKWLGLSTFRRLEPRRLQPVGMTGMPRAASSYAAPRSAHDANIVHPSLEARDEFLRDRLRRPAEAHWASACRTFALSFDEPVDFDGLVDGIEMLLTLRGDQVLRMKGIVNARSSDRPRVLHAVQHTLYPDATLPAWPDADRRTRLVFIVRDLEESFVVSTLQRFAVSEDAAALI